MYVLAFSLYSCLLKLLFGSRCVPSIITVDCPLYHHAVWWGAHAGPPCGIPHVGKVNAKGKLTLKSTELLQNHENTTREADEVFASAAAQGNPHLSKRQRQRQRRQRAQEEEKRQIVEHEERVALIRCHPRLLENMPALELDRSEEVLLASICDEEPDGFVRARVREPLGYREEEEDSDARAKRKSVNRRCQEQLTLSVYDFHDIVESNYAGSPKNYENHNDPGNLGEVKP